MTRVKICGLTQWRDAELAIELGADALGFVFEPASPRFVGRFPGAAEVPLALAPFVSCVAVYGRYTMPQAGCTLTQFVERGRTRPLPGHTYLPVIRPPSGTVYSKAERMVKRAYAWRGAEIGAVVFDAYDPDAYGGTGRAVDWILASDLVHAGIKLVLAGGLNAMNVGDAVMSVRPYAVDVSSGVEISPGVKDPHMMRDFIQAAKSR